MMLADPAHCDHEHRQAVATTKTELHPMETVVTPVVFVVCLDCGRAEEAKL